MSMIDYTELQEFIKGPFKLQVSKINTRDVSTIDSLHEDEDGDT